MTEEKNGKNSSIPRGYLAEDTKARLEWVKKFTGIEIDDSALDKEEDLQGIIENHVGFMKIPMAVVGPMTLNGTYARGASGRLQGELRSGARGGNYGT